MTETKAEKKKAFLVVDLQRGVLADDGTWDADGVVSRVAGLVDRARAAEVPVVWVQHNSGELVAEEEPWQLAHGLEPAGEEPVVQKRYGDSFEETDLADVLSRLGADHLVVAGAQTDACIRSTIHGALVRGYDVTLVSDCHTTGEIPAQYTGGELISARTKINFTNTYASWMMDYPGRSGTTQPSGEVEF
ncbi:isochorismatase family protein [Nocardioides sp. YIM 152315]|uniref:isochorismatase family protein n=1 Tax=Nocardioides sp. YIM 152315 TaxID=3031760 RepID=UPI0023D99CC5|nr:isochorismatase family protein [Nocardioides sp. YIM 152315]MDF1603502.1 isochorismatase family protein [Nocardioides sp. YIM 152315]